MTKKTCLILDTEDMELVGHILNSYSRYVTNNAQCPECANAVKCAEFALRVKTIIDGLVKK